MSVDFTVEDAITCLREHLMNVGPKVVGHIIDQILLTAFISQLEPEIHEFMMDQLESDDHDQLRDDLDNQALEKFSDYERRYNLWIYDTQIAVAPKTEIWEELHWAVERFWETL